MKIRIIGVLAVCVLILSIVVFFKMYLDVRKENTINTNLNGDSQTSAELKNVNMEVIDQDVNNYNSKKFNFDSETIINLSDGATKVEGQNVKIDGDTIYIVAAGCYRISGSLSNGRIIVNAPKEDVKIILDNASIKCEYSSPIYVYKSSNTLIYLEKGTTNTLEDGETYSYNDDFSNEDDEEPNSTLYSKSDLIIFGEGKLVVKANFNNAITSKDALYIEDAEIEVDSKNHGINGKDNLTIKNSSIVLTSGGDAIRSTNDKDDTLGWVRIEGSTIKIDAEEDGIQAEKDIVIYDSNLDIKTGGGVISTNKVDNNVFGRDMWGKNKNQSSSTSETSRKGIKAQRYIVIDKNSKLAIDSSDDAIHSNSSLEINSGVISIKTGDDGIHADETLTINGGDITISESYEGLEGSNIVINAGNIDITSSDDGINVNGGNDNSGFGGFGNTSGKVNVQDKNSSTNKEIGSSDIGLINVATEGSSSNSDKKTGQKPDGSERKSRGERSGQTPPSFDGNMPSDFDGKTPSEFEGQTPPNFNGKMPSDFDGKMPLEFDGQTPPDFDGQMSQGGFNGTSNSSCKLVINGGKITINANGDGLDSNGSIEMNGGDVVVQGPSSNYNSALDYNSSFTLSGGTLIAIGSSGMAQGIKSSGTQGSIMAKLSSSQEANSKIEIKDEDGNVLFEITSTRTFDSIVATSKDVISGNKYSVYINGSLISEEEASLDTSSSGFGGFGRMR